jgi:hypothetical protein
MWHCSGLGEGEDDPPDDTENALDEDGEYV